MIPLLLAGLAASSIAISIIKHIRRRQRRKRAMGLFKLAIIGGIGYYAGKKMSENNTGDGQNNNGWGCNSRWKEQKRQQIIDHIEQMKQQHLPPQQAPTTTRAVPQDTTDDYVYNYHAEKPQQKPTEPQYQVLYTADGRPVEVGNGWWPTYAPRNRDVVKANEPNVTATVNEVKEVPSTPPAYSGVGARPMSPQQRMWPGMWASQPAGEKM